MNGDGFVEQMRAAGHPVSVWENGAGYSYATHSHPYKKVLCCLQGSITFRTDNAEIQLAEGDRMTLESHVSHSAVVGPSGVRCAEAHLED